MTPYFTFLLLGLANGAIYAALALTLVVTFRSSGVLNFASGAMALLAAYLYVNLRLGELVFPLPGLTGIDLGGELSFFPAALITVVLNALVGLLLYGIVFRPLRGATPVAKAVASVGVMVIMIGLLRVRFEGELLSAEAIFPTDSVQIGDSFVPADRLYFAGTILILTFLLAAVYRFTRFGLLTRAAADSERGAYVTGLRPDRIAAANWMISAGVAAIAGILITPIVSLTPDNYILLIVPALGAAVLGQFRFMVPAVFGGLAIGMVQSEMDYLAGKYDWLPASGRSELVVLLLILVVLVVRAKPLPSRGGLITKASLGRAPRPQALVPTAIASTLLGGAAVLLLSGDWRITLIQSFILAIISLSLVVTTGYAGQVSLAQLTLAGVAGFSLSTITIDWNVPFPIAPLLASFFALVVGVVVGLPALRIRGLPVAVVTLATAVTIQALWFTNSDYISAGGADIEGPELFGLDLRARVGTDFPRPEFAMLVLVVLVIVAISVALLRQSPLGSQMLAVRANERSAAGAGIDVVRVKIIAFAIGSFIAGLGGSMLAYYQGNVTFVAFDAILGLFVFTGVYFAGVTSVSGGVMAGVLSTGGIVAYASNEAFGVDALYAAFTGLGLVLVVIFQPDGLVGPVHAKIEQWRKRRVPQIDAPVPHDAHLEPLPPAEGGDVVLEATDVSVRYGGVVAVDGVTISVRQGTIVGLIGPNGAGKTTLLDALSAFAPSTGSVSLVGSDITNRSPFRRVRAGLGRTFQHAELYEDLSVTENVVTGQAAAQGRSSRSVEEVLELLDLADVAQSPVRELSQGRRQLVSIARALVGNPEVLLLDEPAGGLDSHESQWLGLRLRAIRDSGVTILLIDHDMHLVLNLCDAIYVLNFGKVIAHGTAAEIRADRTVAEAYLGATHAEQSVQP